MPASHASSWSVILSAFMNASSKRIAVEVISFSFRSPHPAQPLLLTFDVKARDKATSPDSCYCPCLGFGVTVVVDSASAARVSYSSASLSSAWVAYWSNTARDKARYLSAFCRKNCAPLSTKSSDSTAAPLPSAANAPPLRVHVVKCDVAPSASAASQPYGRGLFWRPAALSR
jgi:hypothetical protein